MSGLFIVSDTRNEFNSINAILKKNPHA